MNIKISGSTNKSENRTFPDFNANVLSETEEMEMGDATMVGLYITGNTGTHNTHVVVLSVSGDDGETYVDTTYKVTGVGSILDITVIGTHVKAKLLTPEGGPSKIDISLVIK